MQDRIIISILLFVIGFGLVGGIRSLKWDEIDIPYKQKTNRAIIYLIILILVLIGFIFNTFLR